VTPAGISLPGSEAAQGLGDRIKGLFGR
jgi:hypothetical protein